MMKYEQEETVKFKRIVKGKPMVASMPVEIGLSLPCMRAFRERLVRSVVVVEDKLVWRCEGGCEEQE